MQAEQRVITRADVVNNALLKSVYTLTCKNIVNLIADVV